jgi:hypothetical protein
MCIRETLEVKSQIYKYFSKTDNRIFNEERGRKDIRKMSLKEFVDSEHFPSPQKELV